jgi:hypothetical protein
MSASSMIVQYLFEIKVISFHKASANLVLHSRISIETTVEISSKIQSSDEIKNMMIAKIFKLLIVTLLVVGSDASQKCTAIDGPANGREGICKVAAKEPCVGHFSSSKECKGDVRKSIYISANL